MRVYSDLAGASGVEEVAPVPSVPLGAGMAPPRGVVGPAIDFAMRSPVDFFSQHFLNFMPEPQGQGSFTFTFCFFPSAPTLPMPVMPNCGAMSSILRIVS